MHCTGFLDPAAEGRCGVGHFRSCRHLPLRGNARDNSGAARVIRETQAVDLCFVRLGLKCGADASPRGSDDGVAQYRSLSRRTV